jgi:hypothetical protein
MEITVTRRGRTITVSVPNDVEAIEIDLLQKSISRARGFFQNQELSH